MPFSLAPLPQWHFTDTFGKLADGGSMDTFTADDHTTRKPVFKDVAGTIPYTNPVVFNGVGASGPFYWNEDVAYYVRFNDKNGNLIWEIDNYFPPTGGGSPVITVNQDLENYANNAQFREQFPLVAAPLPVGPFKFAPDEWYFRKSSTDATDAYTFEATSPGDLEPDPSTLFWLKYTSSAVGAGTETFKDFEYRLRDVRTFQNQSITLSFMVRASGNMIGSSSKVIVTQFFGTGGSPSSPVETISVPSFNTTSDWVLRDLNFVIPSLSGKVIGTNGDDYVSIGLRLPLNTPDNFEFVNFQIQEGTIGSPQFIYQSKFDTEAAIQQNVTVSATDQQAQALEQKLVAGTGLTITKETAANIETLKFDTTPAIQFLSVRTTAQTLINTEWNTLASIPRANTTLLLTLVITPISATSILHLQGTINNISTTPSGVPASEYFVIGTFFKDAQPVAFSSSKQTSLIKFSEGGGGGPIEFQIAGNLSFMSSVVSGAIVPITFELRATSNEASTSVINTPSYGSSSEAVFTITEYLQ